MKRETWPANEIEHLKALWQTEGGRITRIADIMGKTKGQISGKSRILSLHFTGGRSRMLKPGSRAALLGTSVFRHRVAAPNHVEVLKDGGQQRKLGIRVTKGPWKGMPIFSLTLEERATCPRTCKQWLSCYGNTMGMARRYAHGPALEERIVIELADLQRRYPKGFVMRLHILGDFYSLRYVSLWHHALTAFPALRVFGYTAHLPGTPIGDAIETIRDAQWDRFAVRTSGAESGPRTVVFDAPECTSRYLQCPAQTGKTLNCGTCALCWSPAARGKTIAFAAH